MAKKAKKTKKAKKATKTTNRYIALLRGINIGRHKRIKMAELCEMMTGAGYENVKTALATGNIAFDTPPTRLATLEQHLTDTIERTFGFDVPVIVRLQSAIQALIDRDPFARVNLTEQTRLYVTCLPETPADPPDLPHRTDTGSFRLLHLSDRFLCSTLSLDDTRSTDAMTYLKKMFGAHITTRSWNTIQKLADL